MRQILTVVTNANATGEWLHIHISHDDRRNYGEALKEAICRAIDNGEDVIGATGATGPERRAHDQPT